MKRGANQISGDESNQTDLDTLIETKSQSLTVDQLRQLSEAVHQLWLDRASSQVMRLWDDCPEVVDLYLLHPLSRTEPLCHLLELRLVCRRWSHWVRRAHHLNVPKKSSSRALVAYRFLLEVMFTAVVSLEDDVSLMASGTALYTPAFSRINSFRAVMRIDYRYSCAVHGTRWSGLTRLSALRINDCVIDISELRNLTRLSINFSSLPQSRQPGRLQITLATLTQLKRLKIRDFPADFDLATECPRLEYLSSDQCRHFSRHTGRGHLLAHWPTDGQGEPRADPEGELQRDYDLYERDAYSCVLRGCWVQGVFTGRGVVEFIDADESKMSYKGFYKDGQRNGEGTETNEQLWLQYVGTWCQGKRHGAGSLFYCRNLHAFNQKSLPLERHEWVHGILSSKQLL